MHVQGVRVFGLLLALALLWAPGVPRPLAAGEGEDEAAFEVLVVGTIHAPWQFRSRSFHPGHVRAALEAARPDVVGVESNPAWFAEGRFHDVTYEAQAIAVPWAKARAIPVYGVDWMDVESWRERTETRAKAWADNLRRAPEEGRFGLWAFGRVMDTNLPRVREYFAGTEHDFGVVNDISSNAYGRKWLDGAQRRDPFGGHRNGEIVKRCVEVMKAHPRKRLVVVIGAAHKAVLDELFRRRDDVRLLAWTKDVGPPTEAEATAALTPEDRLAILGHNLDGERSYFHAELIDLDRMEEVLAAYERNGGNARIVRYFAARIAGARGEDVRTPLAALADARGDAPPLYPFPLGHWRMAYDLDQAIRLELGRAHLVAGDREAGAQILRRLAEEMPAPEGTYGPRWQMQMLAKAFPRFLLEPPRPVPKPAPASAGVTSPWRAADPAHGPLEIQRDADTGAISVRLEHAEGAGLPFFSRLYPLDAPGGTLAFTARLRGAGIRGVKLVAYVWPEPGRAETIASRDVTLAPGAWQTARLPLEVPEGQRSVGIHVYAQRTAEGTLWLDDARLEPVR